MKRLIAFVFVGLSLFCVKFVKKDFNYLELFGEVEKSCFVVKAETSTSQNEAYNEILFNSKDFNKLRNQTKFESVMLFLKSDDMNAFLKNAKVENVTKRNGEEFFMAYSPYIDFFEMIDGKKYNIEILKDDKLIVGLPKILNFD